MNFNTKMIHALDDELKMKFLHTLDIYSGIGIDQAKAWLERNPLTGSIIEGGGIYNNPNDYHEMVRTLNELGPEIFLREVQIKEEQEPKYIITLGTGMSVVNAMKLMRILYGCGLKESKEFIIDTKHQKVGEMLTMDIPLEAELDEKQLQEVKKYNGIRDISKVA